MSAKHRRGHAVDRARGRRHVELGCRPEHAERSDRIGGGGVGVGVGVGGDARLGRALLIPRLGAL